ncbi:hypothetical protein ACLOJK_007238 [Asimina triloba]
MARYLWSESMDPIQARTDGKTALNIFFLSTIQSSIPLEAICFVDSSGRPLDRTIQATHHDHDVGPTLNLMSTVHPRCRCAETASPTSTSLIARRLPSVDSTLRHRLPTPLSSRSPTTHRHHQCKCRWHVSNNVAHHQQHHANDRRLH